MSRYASKNGIGGSVGETDIINAAAESLVVDVQEFDRTSLYVVQVTDAGTVNLIVEESPDGVLFAQVGAAITEATFPVGNGVCAPIIALESGNGMPRVVKQVRVRATALAGGGVYKLVAAGTIRPGVR